MYNECFHVIRWFSLPRLQTHHQLGICLPLFSRLCVNPMYMYTHMHITNGFWFTLTLGLKTAFTCKGQQILCMFTDRLDPRKYYICKYWCVTHVVHIYTWPTQVKVHRVYDERSEYMRGLYPLLTVISH